MKELTKFLVSFTDYAKKDPCCSQTDFLWYPSQYLEYARSLLTLSRCEWDYELEKSYWFDTTAHEQNISPADSSTEGWKSNSQKSPEINNYAKKGNSDQIPAIAENTNKFVLNTKDASLPIGSNNNHYDFRTEENDLPNINVGLNKMKPKIEPVVPAVPKIEPVVSAVENANEKKLAWGNLDEKLNHMLG